MQRPPTAPGRRPKTADHIPQPGWTGIVHIHRPRLAASSDSLSLSLSLSLSRARALFLFLRLSASHPVCLSIPLCDSRQSRSRRDRAHSRDTRCGQPLRAHPRTRSSSHRPRAYTRQAPAARQAAGRLAASPLTRLTRHRPADPRSRPTAVQRLSCRAASAGASFATQSPHAEPYASTDSPRQPCSTTEGSAAAIAYPPHPIPPPPQLE